MKSDNGKMLSSLAGSLSERMTRLSNDENQMRSMDEVCEHGKSLGMSDDLTFFLAFIIGRLAVNNNKEEVLKYMNGMVESQFHMLKGVENESK